MRRSIIKTMELEDGKTSVEDTLKKSKKRARIVVNLSNCKYPLVEEAVNNVGWVVSRDEKTDWDLFWTDTSVSEERVMKLKKFQKINHFAGMNILARKVAMAKVLRRMGVKLPQHFAFMPQTWLLPTEASELKLHSKKQELKWLIVKPDNGSQGKGIFLTDDSDKACCTSPAGVAQEYIDRPFLIDGFKFDMRIYVLVTSCDPLRVYIYKEGLARFCTEPYMPPSRSNADIPFVHLTNYSINKRRDNFTCDSYGFSGFKRTFTSVCKWLREHGHNSQAIWEEIQKLVAMTLIAAQPSLARTYRQITTWNREDKGTSCFELLGIDILLDEQLKPWLLEINHSPSFGCDNDVDRRVKLELLTDTLKILNLSSKHKKWIRRQERNESASRLYGAAPKRNSLNAASKVKALRLRHEEDNCGNFERILPPSDSSPHLSSYEDAMHTARALFDSTSYEDTRPLTSRAALSTAPSSFGRLPSPLFSSSVPSSRLSKTVSHHSIQSLQMRPDPPSSFSFLPLPRTSGVVGEGRRVLGGDTACSWEAGLSFASAMKLRRLEVH